MTQVVRWFENVQQDCKREDLYLLVLCWLLVRRMRRIRVLSLRFIAGLAVTPKLQKFICASDFNWILVYFQRNSIRRGSNSSRFLFWSGRRVFFPIQRERRVWIFLLWCISQGKVQKSQLTKLRRNPDKKTRMSCFEGCPFEVFRIFTSLSDHYTHALLPSPSPLPQRPPHRQVLHLSKQPCVLIRASVLVREIQHFLYRL